VSSSVWDEYILNISLGVSGIRATSVVSFQRFYIFEIPVHTHDILFFICVYFLTQSFYANTIDLYLLFKAIVL
jgi:hypothetical protein